MYEVADRALPFTRSERDSAVQLGVKVATAVSAGAIGSVLPYDYCAHAMLCIQPSNVNVRVRAIDHLFEGLGVCHSP